MRNIVLYAPPAAGKGSVCEELVKEYGYEVLSIGQVLREARDPETEVGRTIIEYQDQGKLVPDALVGEALKNEFKKYALKPVIIDGYPRNLAQAKLLDSILSNYIVINLYVDREIAMKRTLGRLTCGGCNKIYNKFFPEMAPKEELICDVCGSKLLDRSDDNENAFNVRFDIYEENEKDILKYYEEKNVLYRVSSNGTPKERHDEITKILSEE